MRWLDEFLGDIGRAIAAHPRAFAFAWIAAVLLITAPRARAQSYDAMLLPNGSLYVCGLHGSCAEGRTSAPSPAIKVGDDLQYLKINSDTGTQTINLDLSPAKQFTQPPTGWTRNSGGTMVPPSSAGSATISGYSTGGGTFSTQLAACENQRLVSGGGVPTTANVHPDNTCWWTSSGSGLPTGNIPIVPVLTCPAGYTNSSGTCNLSNASLVQYPANQPCAITRTGSVLSFDSRNPNCNAATAGTVANATNLSAPGTADASISGGGSSVTLHVNGDGSTTITYSGPNGAGGTTTHTVTVGAPATGKSGTVLGTSTSTVAGSGSGSGSGSQPGQEACGSPGQPKCSVRVDETGVSGAEAPATSAADALKAQIDALKTSADAAKAGSGDMSAFGLPTYTPSSDDANKVIVPITGSDSCTAPVITYRGTDLTLNGICTVTNAAKPILAWALSVIASLYAWFRFSRQPT